METAKKSFFRFNIYHTFLLSFVVVFIVNLVVNWNNWSTILGVFTGDILKGNMDTLMAFDAIKFGKVFSVLIVETLVLTSAFAFVSKKIV